MSLMTSTFVVAVHYEILKGAGVGREGCNYDKIQDISIKDHTGLDDLIVDIVESQDDQELLALSVSDFLDEISEI